MESALSASVELGYQEAVTEYEVSKSNFYRHR